MTVDGPTGELHVEERYFVSRITLHIGTEKTGTTSIQHFLDINADVLAEQGVNYPHFLESENHHKLVAYASNSAPRQDIHDWHYVHEENLGAFRVELECDFADHLPAGAHWIFSSEHLSSRLLQPEELERLAVLLNRYASEVTVVVYLRRQDKMAESMYSTEVRNGWPDRFSVDRVLKTVARYDYLALIQRWRAAFPSADFVILPFDDIGSEPEDLFRSFIAALDLEWDDRLLIPTSPLNESKSLMEIEALRAFNRSFTMNEFEELRSQFESRMGETFGGQRKFRLTAGERRSILEGYGARNVILAKTYGVPDLERWVAESVEVTNSDVTGPADGDPGMDEFDCSEVMAVAIAVVADQLRQAVLLATDKEELHRPEVG